jgi:metal-dependent amidase/aminoacylase/carboxypeptidase family protein
VPIVEQIASLEKELTAWRRDIHAHPELGFEEQRTSDFVAGKLAEFGIEVHRGIGRTGVVGVLKSGTKKSIGLRADMDALPIQEENDFAHRSRHAGRMHACGHDGHTTMLLGAAKYLAEGRGAHGARPETGIDPVLVAAQLVGALQSLISRNVRPRTSPTC